MVGGGVEVPENGFDAPVPVAPVPLLFVPVALVPEAVGVVVVAD